MRNLSLFSSIMILFLSAISTGIYAQKYEVDRESSVLRWEGANLLRSHNGTIMLSGGELELKAGTPVNARIVVDMTTIRDLDIESENNRLRLENHLKSDDFFGVETHPEAVFVLRESVKNNGGSYLLKGELTIKGITNPVEFTTNFSKEGSELVFTGHMDIDRSLFDVRYGSGKFFDGLGDRAINDIFTIDFELHLVE